MPGVPGRGGPPPKRAEERRRRNKVDIDNVTMAGKVEIPAADESWHPTAAAWYASLAKSGQHKFYEPSDWAAAHLVADQMSRMLQSSRPSSQMFAAVWSAMGDLLTTEGERRRVRVEIERKTPGEKPQLASVTPIDRYGSL